MSLAIGRLVASVVFGVLLIRWSPIPYRFGWDREIARRLLGFGLPLAGASIIVFAAGYADQVIVGSIVGVQALGFYVLAYNLASWPVSIFSLPLRAVAPAAFSALKSEPERMTRGFSRILAILACVALPACLAISGAAAPVVAFVYGSSWGPAADVLLWLAAFAALRILFELAYDYLVVQGKSGVVMLIQAASFVVALPIMLWAGRRDGQAGVAAVQFVVALVVVAPLYVLALHRIGVRASRVTASVIVPTVAALGVWGVSRVLATSVDGAFLGAGSAGVFALCVIAALTVWKRAELRLLRAAVRGREAT